MRGSFEYRTVCWWRHYRSRWRHIKKRLGRLIDFGLNFNLIKKFWGFPYHSPHNKVKRTPYFQIFYSTKNRDIDSKSINKGLFLAKSSMENSISLSVFWNFDVWYSCELMISLAIIHRHTWRTFTTLKRKRYTADQRITTLLNVT